VSWKGTSKGGGFGKKNTTRGRRKRRESKKIHVFIKKNAQKEGMGRLKKKRNGGGEKMRMENEVVTTVIKKRGEKEDFWGRERGKSPRKRGPEDGDLKKKGTRFGGKSCKFWELHGGGKGKNFRKGGREQRSPYYCFLVLCGRKENRGKKKHKGLRGRLKSPNLKNNYCRANSTGPKTKAGGKVLHRKKETGLSNLERTIGGWKKRNLVAMQGSIQQGKENLRGKRDSQKEPIKEKNL